MPVTLHRRESASHGLARIFGKQTARALRALSDAPISDRSLHDARKRLKEARAVLRLLREHLGGRAYRRANRGLRDAARPFAGARDAKVLQEAFDGLARPRRARGRVPARRAVRRDIDSKRARGGVPGRDAPGPIPVRFVDAVRTFLAEDRRRVRRRSLGARARKTARKIVKASRDGVLNGSMSGSGWRTIAAGVRRVYRSGREALRAARRFPSVENLHEWRKQAKYLRHALEILPRARRPAGTEEGESAPGGQREREPAIQARRLTDLLGEDHDLAMLEAKLAPTGEGTGVPREAVSHVEALIALRRASLQRRAFALGDRLFAPPPADFEKGLHVSWRAWKDGR